MMLHKVTATEAIQKIKEAEAALQSREETALVQSVEWFSYAAGAREGYAPLLVSLADCLAQTGQHHHVCAMGYRAALDTKTIESKTEEERLAAAYVAQISAEPFLPVEKRVEILERTAGTYAARQDSSLWKTALWGVLDLEPKIKSERKAMRVLFGVLMAPGVLPEAHKKRAALRLCARVAQTNEAALKGRYASFLNSYVPTFERDPQVVFRVQKVVGASKKAALALS